MKNILFIGRFYPPRLLQSIDKNAKYFSGYSTHNYETAAIGGLSENKHVELKVLTCPAVYSYPYHNDRVFTHAESFTMHGVICKSVGFCNLAIINKLYAFVATLLNILALLRSFSGNDVNIICNLASQPRAVQFAKALSRKKVYVTYLVLDIPQMVSDMSKMSKMKSAVMKHTNRKLMDVASSADHLILLTEQMMDFIPKPVDHIVVEGWVDRLPSQIEHCSSGHKNVILYSGTLRRIFGVMDLVHAFQLIPFQDAQLWICGSGDTASEISEVSNSDSRIKYFGLVSAEKARDLQNMASILVNPRTSKGDYTKYSFPSKTLEYLLAGKPTVAYRLPGIPPEYFDYIIAPKEESCAALAATLVQLLEMDADMRNQIASAGQKFVLENKTPKAQMEKVLKMLYSN